MCLLISQTVAFPVMRRRRRWHADPDGSIRAGRPSFVPQRYHRYFGHTYKKHAELITTGSNPQPLGYLTPAQTSSTIRCKAQGRSCAVGLSHRLLRRSTRLRPPARAADTGVPLCSAGWPTPTWTWALELFHLWRPVLKLITGPNQRYRVTLQIDCN